MHRRFGLPFWQFCLTATDANRFTIRLARAITVRPKILVFNYCYHGSVDETIVTIEDGVPGPRIGNVGAPVDPTETTRVVEFNDVDALEAALRARGRGMRARRAGAHEHRDRPARARVPRRPANPHAPTRHVPGDRRDPHAVRRTGRRDEGVGPGARLPHGRQAARERRARGLLRDERRRWPNAPTRSCALCPRPTSGIGGTLSGNALVPGRDAGDPRARPDRVRRSNG